jgi:aryl-alcohol dehydrogenase-like predicted oxidoreductase
MKQHREELVICSKGGFQLQDRPGASTPFVPNSSPEFLRECITGSLQRLGTDHLDVGQPGGSTSEPGTDLGTTLASTTGVGSHEEPGWRAA